MSAELTRLERDLVISSLTNEKSDLDVTSIDVLSSSQTVSPDNYSILDGKILFIPSSAAAAHYRDKERLSVFFYYKKRGMYFEAPVRIVKNGFAIVLPEKFYKQSDSQSENGKGLSAVLFYSSGKNSDVQITAQTHELFPLFEKNLRRSVPPDLLNNVLHQVTRLRTIDRKAAVTDEQLVLSLAHFFCRPLLKKQSVEGRFQPLIILYISETSIVFGCDSPDMMLSLNAEYGIRIDFPAGKFVRPLYASVLVTKITGDSDDVYDTKKTGAVCRFTSLKEEDKRLLFEKSRGTSYSVPFTASAPRK